MKILSALITMGKIELNKIALFFPVFVAKVVAEKKIAAPTVIAGTQPYEGYCISLYTIMDDDPYKSNITDFHFSGSQ